MNHLKKFEGIKWYSKGKLEPDMNWVQEEDIGNNTSELTPLKITDLKIGLDLYRKDGMKFGIIEDIYDDKVRIRTTRRQGYNSIFICPVDKILSYQFKKKN